MSQNYAGRVTLIVVVLLIGLFGIPGLSDGIFSLKNAGRVSRHAGDAGGDGCVALEKAR